MITAGIILGLALLAASSNWRLTPRGDTLPWATQGYRSLFEQHPDAVYAFDLEGTFVSANSACSRLSGYDVTLLCQGD